MVTFVTPECKSRDLNSNNSSLAQKSKETIFCNRLFQHLFPSLTSLRLSRGSIYNSSRAFKNYSFIRSTGRIQDWRNLKCLQARACTHAQWSIPVLWEHVDISVCSPWVFYPWCTCTLYQSLILHPYFSVPVSANSQVTNHLPSKPDLITGTFMKHTPGGGGAPSYTNIQEDILGMIRFWSKSCAMRYLCSILSTVDLS